MINKTKLWFLTISSIIFVLVLYYVVSPFDTTGMVFKEADSNKADISIKESETLTAMKVNKDSERQKVISDLQNNMLEEDKSINEKNEVYEQIQYLNNINTLEEKLETDLKKKFQVNSFIEIKDNNLNVTLANIESSYKYANNIISFINSKTNNTYYTSVKFE